MRVDLSGPDRLGISMIFPVTWEENVAANMTKIPLLELFPGSMVSTLYKAYRTGLGAGRFFPYSGMDPGDLTVGYIADSTGQRADVVKDFLDAMIKTVAQGKAPASIITGIAPTGTAEKTGQVFSEVTDKAGSGIKSALVPLAILGVSVFGIYLLSTGIIPGTKR